MYQMYPDDWSSQRSGGDSDRPYADARFSPPPARTVAASSGPVQESLDLRDHGGERPDVS